MGDIFLAHFVPLSTNFCVWVCVRAYVSVSVHARVRVCVRACVCIHSVGQ